MTEVKKTTRLPGRVREYEHLWNGDFSKLDLLSESITFSDPFRPDQTYQGRDAFQIYLKEVLAEFPNFRVKTVDFVTGEDTFLLERIWIGDLRGKSSDNFPSSREIKIHAMSEVSIHQREVVADKLLWSKRSIMD